MSTNGSRSLEERVSVIEDEHLRVVAAQTDLREAREELRAAKREHDSEFRLVAAQLRDLSSAVGALTSGHGELFKALRESGAAGTKALESLTLEMRALRSSFDAEVGRLTDAATRLASTEQQQRDSQMELESQRAAMTLAQTNLASLMRDAGSEGAATGARQGTQLNRGAFVMSTGTILLTLIKFVAENWPG